MSLLSMLGFGKRSEPAPVQQSISHVDRMLQAAKQQAPRPDSVSHVDRLSAANGSPPGPRLPDGVSQFDKLAASRLDGGGVSKFASICASGECATVCDPHANTNAPAHANINGVSKLPTAGEVVRIKEYQPDGTYLDDRSAAREWSRLSSMIAASKSDPNNDELLLGLYHASLDEQARADTTIGRGETAKSDIHSKMAAACRAASNGQTDAAQAALINAKAMKSALAQSRQPASERPETPSSKVRM